MSAAKFIVGEALDVLKSFDDNSVQCVVTSPPYWGSRTYTDDEAELGKGPLTQYLDDLIEICRQVQRVLDPGGLFWLNVGEVASGSGGAGGDYNSGGNFAGRPKYRQGDSGLAPMQWCGIPQRLALRLQDDGWLFRSWITWDKGKERREDLEHVRRPRPASEPILMLAKSRHYRFFPDGLTETGDVWHFSPSAGTTGHQAPFPLELPRRCILASTQPGDLVCDPFCGSGTTLEASFVHGRPSVGIDLDPRNAELARDRCGMWLEVEESTKESSP
jgi:site-specific DNA-methyltransferase (cytosine-N4-specific)